MIDFSTDSEIIISQLVCPSLQVLAPAPDVLGNLVVLLRERGHLIAEFGGLSPAFDLDLTSDRAELIDVARSDLFLDRQQLEVELLLVGLLEERDEELACLEHLRSKHRVKEALIVLLALNELARVLLFGLGRGEGRDNDLRVRAKQEVSQNLEV